MTESFTAMALEYASAIIRAADVVEVFGISIWEDANDEDRDALDDLKERVAKTIGSMEPIRRAGR